MAEHLIETIKKISTPPADGAAFDEWLDATDGIDLLKENIQRDEFVFYATPGGTFIHSILVPAANVNPTDVEDLMAWSFNAYGTWGVSYTLTDSPRIWLDAPFKNSGTKSFEGGSRLIFPRDFEGRLGNKHFGHEVHHARAITAPLHEAHYMRSKVKGHAAGGEATEIRKKTLRDHGTYRKHFESLCTRCDEAVRTIAEAFTAFR